jgi:diguanylate cyclase (GGDEF)-like protein
VKLNVTISLGAAIAQDGDSMAALLKRADELLYESKKAGRNRLTLG